MLKLERKIKYANLKKDKELLGFQKLDIFTKENKLQKNKTNTKKAKYLLFVFAKTNAKNNTVIFYHKFVIAFNVTIRAV